MSRKPSCARVRFSIDPEEEKNGVDIAEPGEPSLLPEARLVDGEDISDRSTKRSFPSFKTSDLLFPARCLFPDELACFDIDDDPLTKEPAVEVGVLTLPSLGDTGADP